MRWPFRRGETTTESVTDSAGIVASADVAADPPASPAWATLPVLQRTLDDASVLTAPTGGMLGDVAERWTPVTALEPLGHDVGGLAPVGTIALAGAPIEAGLTGPELVDRPARPSLAVQRTAGPAVTTVAATAVDATPVAGDLPPRPEPFRAAVVADEPPAAIQRSLVSAADANGAAGPSIQTASSRVEAPPPTIARLRSPVDGADRPVGSEPDALQRTTSGADPVVAPTRRLGLGAPVARGGGEMPLQRTATSSWNDPPREAAPAERPERPPRVPVQRLTLDELPLTRQLAVGSSSSAAVSRGVDADREPSPGRSGPVSGDPGSDGVTDAVPAAVVTGAIDVSRLAADAGPVPAAPRAVVHRPLVRVQRDLDTASPGPPTGPILRLGRSATTDEAVTGGPDRNPVPAAHPAPDLPRAIGATASPLPVQRERSTPDVAVDLSPIATWRSAPAPGPTVSGRGSDEPSSWVAPETGRGSEIAPPLRLQRMSASSIGAAGTSRTAPPAGSLVLARAPQPPAPVPLDVQRSSTTATLETSPANRVAPTVPASSADAFDLEIQRATDDAVGATPPPAEATSTPSGGPGGGSDKDLDELARRLYDRIRRRLLRELLTDRERAGMLTDLR